MELLFQWYQLKVFKILVRRKKHSLVWFYKDSLYGIAVDTSYFKNINTIIYQAVLLQYYLNKSYLGIY